MTYSSALFPGRGAARGGADAASTGGLDRIGAAQPGHHLLEIGCGWGGFAEYAAARVRRHGHRRSRSRGAARLRPRRASRRPASPSASRSCCRTTATSRHASTGSPRSRCSRRSASATGRSTSARVRERLTPGRSRGAAGDHHRRPLLRDLPAQTADFIQRHVFPGGMLPSPVGARRADRARRALREIAPFTFGRHYARTLAGWQQRFQASWPRDPRPGLRRALQADLGPTISPTARRASASATPTSARSTLAPRLTPSPPPSCRRTPARLWRPRPAARRAQPAALRLPAGVLRRDRRPRPRDRRHGAAGGPAARRAERSADRRARRSHALALRPPPPLAAARGPAAAGLDLAAVPAAADGLRRLSAALVAASPTSPGR